ncbi:hypothetical protein FGB62_457g012 [Gracilaria domingensis]|nr:hypothetical protein FGB62_540g00 [Gracilaria domingensis]KAI0556665.1 hypothetical protein FGB62_457g012 [Gracilaria domingensis]
MLSQGQGFSTKIKNFSAVLKESETVNSILMKLIAQPGSGKGAVEVSKDELRTLFDAGQPAEWVTHGEELALRKKKAEAAQRGSEEKERKKAEQAEQRAKDRETAERLASERKRKRLFDQIRREAESKKRKLEAAQQSWLLYWVNLLH